MPSAQILGPWGGAGGDAFDDGWQNAGISKLTVYYTTTIRGLEVVYGNGKTVMHGRRAGTAKEIQVNSSAGEALTDIRVTVGRNSDFSGDPNNNGVVALGFSTSTVTDYPSGANGVGFRPEIVGFFGSAGTNMDRLGVYISNVRN